MYSIYIYSMCMSIYTHTLLFMVMLVDVGGLMLVVQDMAVCEEVETVLSQSSQDSSDSDNSPGQFFSSSQIPFFNGNIDQFL